MGDVSYEGNDPVRVGLLYKWPVLGRSGVGPGQVMPETARSQGVSDGAAHHADHPH